MANWVIFIPRVREVAEMQDSGNKPSLLSQAQRWKADVISKGEGAKYTFHVVCHGEMLPVALADTDVVYLYGGHGLTSQDFVSWPGNSDNPITSSQMVERVKPIVPPTFKGRLKVYSCYSGSAGETAYANRLTKLLRAESFQCRIFGYKGQVTQAYEELKPIVKMQMKGKFPDADPTAFNGSHRWSVMGDVGKAMYQGRAKGDREEF